MMEWICYLFQLCNLVLHTVIDCTLALQNESFRETGVSMVVKDDTDKEAGDNTEKNDKPRPATFWLHEKYGNGNGNLRWQ
jgi:hypothetical protein